MKRSEIADLCGRLGVRVKLDQLPCHMWGMTTKYGSGYLVIIEEAMREPQRWHTLLHELIHIMEGHLERDMPVDEMEFIVANLLPQTMDDYDFDRSDPVEDIEARNPY